jgi:putative acetyltransferase
LKVTLRAERPGDEAAIFAVTEAAFRGQPHSDGSEPAVVNRLRADGDLALSLVAENEEGIVGHIAFSRVSIADGARDWYGLGPVSVTPNLQMQGIGSRLIEGGLDELQKLAARGVVLLGSPAYYRRFGFEHDPALVYPGPPAEYFQRLVLEGDAPRGIVMYAAAFT